MPIPRKGLIALLLVVAAGVALYAATRPEPVPVRLVTVDRGTVEATVANTRAGTVKACRRARLSLPVGGQIQTLAVREGDRVEQGELLLELWNQDLKAERTLAEQQLAAAGARADEACVLAEVAERDARRIERLYRQKAASEERRDQATGQASAARARCAAARSEREVAAARLQVAKAAVARTQLLAPFPGVVAEINGELSEFVTPSPVGVATPPAVDLIDGCCLFVSAPLDEVDAPRVQPGQPARIHLDAFPKHSFPGKVRRVAPYVQDREREARTVEIEVDFDVPGLGTELKPGYSADVEILLERHEDSLRVPTEALLEGPKVLVYDAHSSTLKGRAVKTGIANWRWTEILEGLEAGERVAVSIDREGVVDGARVRPEAEPSER